MKRLTFFLDENVSIRLGVLLKKRGYDVISVKSLKMQGAVNGTVFSETVKLGRVFITMDSDFLTLKEYFLV